MYRWLYLVSARMAQLWPAIAQYATPSPCRSYRNIQPSLGHADRPADRRHSYLVVNLWKILHTRVMWQLSCWDYSSWSSTDLCIHLFWQNEKKAAYFFNDERLKDVSVRIWVSLKINVHVLQTMKRYGILQETDWGTAQHRILKMV